MKVYCEKCKYYYDNSRDDSDYEDDEGYDVLNPTHSCTSNSKEKCYDTPIKRICNSEYEDCYEKNKDNDCIEFKKSWLA